MSFKIYNPSQKYLKLHPHYQNLEHYPYRGYIVDGIIPKKKLSNSSKTTPHNMEYPLVSHLESLLANPTLTISAKTGAVPQAVSSNTFLLRGGTPTQGNRV
jgi:hypothetical protein